MNRCPIWPSNKSEKIYYTEGVNQRDPEKTKLFPLKRHLDVTLMGPNANPRIPFPHVIIVLVHLPATLPILAIWLSPVNPELPVNLLQAIPPRLPFTLGTPFRADPFGISFPKRNGQAMVIKEAMCVYDGPLGWWMPPITTTLQWNFRSFFWEKLILLKYY